MELGFNAVEGPRALRFQCPGEAVLLYPIGPGGLIGPAGTIFSSGRPVGTNFFAWPG